MLRMLHARPHAEEILYLKFGQMKLRSQRIVDHFNKIPAVASQKNVSSKKLL